MRMPEVNQCPLQLLSTLLFETGSLTEPGAQQLMGQLASELPRLTRVRLLPPCLHPAVG